MFILFGSTECKKCSALRRELENLKGVDLEFIDANAENTQSLCDKYNVDKLPHVVWLNDDGSIKGTWIADQTQTLLKNLNIWLAKKQ